MDEESEYEVTIEMPGDQADEITTISAIDVHVAGELVLDEYPTGRVKGVVLLG